MSVNEGFEKFWGDPIIFNKKYLPITAENLTEAVSFNAYEAGQRQGMERAAEIADNEMKDDGFSRDIRFGMKVVRDLLRKEIKP